MRVKKIRNHNRIWKEIEEWRKANLHLNLQDLRFREREYLKIRIHPFSSISLLESNFPEPEGKTRKLILNGLLDIYNSWEQQLETLGEPYYLKIWLYDPRFSRSQVVCAIGSVVDFYKHTFHQPDNSKEFPEELLGNARGKAKDFKWEYALDEEHLDENFIGEPEEFLSEEEYFKNRKWFRSKLKGRHRRITEGNPDGSNTTYYSFSYGRVWLGGSRK